MAQLLYPIGIQSFSGIRNDGYVYVDKTNYIHQLVTSGKYYFLSRPRRFGKSLLISTIEEFFQGNRKLFEGLAIMRHDHDWEPHPVFHIDLSSRNYTDDSSLTAHLNSILEEWENKYCSSDRKSDRAPEERFAHIIRLAHEQMGKRVVVLVDEYDKPLLETVGKPKLQEKYRNQLRAFYSNLKSQDGHIRFAMLTGVTKFGHLSIFSDLNNLHDISLSEAYSGICGVTKEEVYEYFKSGVHDFARHSNCTDEEIHRLLKKNYDGYHFSPQNSPDVFNPFSLLNCLSDKFFGDYWFRTGTPAFLMRMIRDRQLPLKDLSGYETSVDSLSDVSLDLGEPIPVLYQTGYLTIKGYDSRFGTVTLGIPNGEVERGFFRQLLPFYTSLSAQKSSFEIGSFVRDVEAGNTDRFNAASMTGRSVDISIFP